MDVISIQWITVCVICDIIWNVRVCLLRTHILVDQPVKAYKGQVICMLALTMQENHSVGLFNAATRQ